MCKITSLSVIQGAAPEKQAKKNKKNTKQTDTAAEGEEKKAKEEEDEEIPQLVPIATPSKKPKLEVSASH